MGALATLKIGYNTGNDLAVQRIYDRYMIKGVNRNVIVVKTDKNSRFETAYFLLRPERRGDAGGAIAEARELISAGEKQGKRKKRFFRILRSALYFVLGVGTGAGGVILLQTMLG